MSEEIRIDMERDYALVLFEWLARTSRENRNLGFEDQAEQRAVWDLEAALEQSLTEVFDPKYKRLLFEARERIRDEE